MRGVSKLLQSLCVVPINNVSYVETVALIIRDNFNYLNESPSIQLIVYILSSAFTKSDIERRRLTNFPAVMTVPDCY